MKKHAKFGSPSTLYRTEKCPGWIAYTKDMPDPPPSPYAVEGTCFHDYMEKCAPIWLTQLKTPATKAINKIIAGCEYEDMPDFIWGTLLEIEKLWKSFCEKHENPKIAYEVNVKITEDIFGTSDVVFSGENKKSGLIDIIAIDYKYGQGTPVSAEENLQGIAYGLGSVKTLKINPESVGTLMVIIAQVRLDDGWTRFAFKGNEIKKYEQKIVAIVETAKDIYAGKAPMQLSAGRHCKFCKADGICTEQKKSTVDTVQITASELPIEEQVKQLTLDEQVAVFLKKSEIEDFLDAVAKNLTAAFQAGITHPALKIIRTAGRRAWVKDEKLVATTLKKKGIKDPYKKKLIGITDAEKILGKGEVPEKCVTLSDGKFELVRAADKRDGISFAEIKELPE